MSSLNIEHGNPINILKGPQRTDGRGWSEDSGANCGFRHLWRESELWSRTLLEWRNVWSVCILWHTEASTVIQIGITTFESHFLTGKSEWINDQSFLYTKGGKGSIHLTFLVVVKFNTKMFGQVKFSFKVETLSVISQPCHFQPLARVGWNLYLKWKRRSSGTSFGRAQNYLSNNTLFIEF